MQAARLSGEALSGAPSDQPLVLSLEDVYKTFGKKKNTFNAIENVNLDIYSGEFFTLLGPAGCGKSTLLRLIAGLDIPSPGTIAIDDMECTSWPAHERPVNMIFPDFALFPHMSVSENIGFGLRMKKMASHEIAREVMGAMQLLELVELATVKPRKLNRVQAQRVAVARALVNEPKVLLLDEPLAGLDLRIRNELQAKLRELQQNLTIPFVMATENQADALALSDRVAVMNKGRIEQVGRPAELYEHPANPFVAGFVGRCNLIDGRFLYREGSEVVVETKLGKIRCTFTGLEAEKADQNEVTLAIRPEKIRINQPTDSVNLFTGTIIEIDYRGASTELKVRQTEQVIDISITNSELGLSQVQIGDTIGFAFPPSNLLLMDAK